MFLQIPKVQKSTGKLVDTVVDPNAILGMDLHEITYQGKTYKGTKVYVAGGSFYALATPAMLFEAKHMALKSGMPQVVQPLGSKLIAEFVTPKLQAKGQVLSLKA